jgi:N-acetylmuramoyl-L-alanine amidase
MSQPESGLNIVWKGTGGHNFWTGRDGETPVAIVDHCMSRGADGTRATLESCAAWFANPTSEVSAHFGVGKDGRVWQFVDLQNTAWANGILEQPDMTLPWLAECVSQKINPNRRTISIEHEGDSPDTMPEAQYRSTLALHRWLVATAGITPDRQHIAGHYQITGRQRANCPGPGFPWSRLLRDLAAGPGSFQDPVTGFGVNEPFASFWRDNGGLSVFGRPISEVSAGGKAFPDCQAVQWFERARFELHAGGAVMLGLVGREARAYSGKIA